MRIPSRLYHTPEIQNRTERIAKGERAEHARGEQIDEAERASDEDVRVEISSRARQVASDNAMDVGKVQRLRSAIDAGGLNMNFERIANRIVESGG
jgi:flagellar biosynthesis anti-sigma factor FlgM